MVIVLITIPSTVLERSWSPVAKGNKFISITRYDWSRRVRYQPQTDVTSKKKQNCAGEATRPNRILLKASSHPKNKIYQKATQQSRKMNTRIYKRQKVLTNIHNTQEKSCPGLDVGSFKIIYPSLSQAKK